MHDEGEKDILKEKQRKLTKEKKDRLKIFLKKYITKEKRMD